MELIDLKALSVYKSKHKESSLQDFYKCLNKEELKNLLTLAKQTFSLFGSTYICEQTFSVMNFNKTPFQLTVGSVVEWLKRRTRDQHGLDSKPACPILLCP